MTNAQILAFRLLEIEAIKIQPSNPFTWSSGIKSPIYCDNRKALAYPEIRKIIISEFDQLASNYSDVDVVAGVATAGIAHGVLLADRLDLPYCYVRPKPKEHGTGQQIEGVIQAKQNCILVEDLISTGGSALKAAEVLRKSQVNVLAVFAIFTYGFARAQTSFDLENMPLHTILDIDTLLEVARNKELIESKEIGIVKDWIKNYN